MAIGSPRQHAFGGYPVYSARPVDEYPIEITWADNSAFSATWDFYNWKTFSLFIPSTFVGDTISFVGSSVDTEDENHMYQCYNGDKGVISFKVVANSICNPLPDQLYGLRNLRYLKLVSGTVVIPVLQTTAMTLWMSRLG